MIFASGQHPDWTDLLWVLLITFAGLLINYWWVLLIAVVVLLAIEAIFAAIGYRIAKWLQ